jgi:hypothetical protein
MIVRTGSSLIGSSVAVTPSARASAAVTAE